MQSAVPRMCRLRFALLVGLAIASSWCLPSASRAASPDPAEPLGADGRSAVVVLMYHRIADIPEDRAKQYVLPKSRFEQQLAWLRKAGYTSIDPVEWIEAMKRGIPVAGRKVILSFDDGHDSDGGIAMPLLERHGFRGLFFPTTRALTGPRLARYRDAVRRGHRVGSHTVHHYYLTRHGPGAGACGRPVGCTREDVARELVESRRTLGQAVAPTVLLAWPGNFYDPETIQQAVDAGYEGIFAVERQVQAARGDLVGTPGTTVSPREIFRIEIDGRCTMDEFRRAVTEQRGCVHSGRPFHRFFIPQHAPHHAPALDSRSGRGTRGPARIPPTDRVWYNIRRIGR